MIPTVTFKGAQYPAFQATGQASRFVMPFALEVCKGHGVDVGCNRPEWAFPGATLVDLTLPDEWDAYNLPPGPFDFVFSSHCLEHLPDWVGALDHWRSRLVDGGTLFLYLPHPDQKYWRPHHNRKHLHVLEPDAIRQYLEDTGCSEVFVSGRDLNHSFAAMATHRKLLH